MSCMKEHMAKNKILLYIRVIRNNTFLIESLLTQMSYNVISFFLESGGTLFQNSDKPHLNLQIDNHPDTFIQGLVFN